jgi:hypothetical protein
MVTKDEKNIKIIDFGSSLDLDGTEFERKIAELKKKEKKKTRYFTFCWYTQLYGPRMRS